jgi:hypothetical protein
MVPNLLPMYLRARLRAASLCDESTISKWWADRASVRPSIDARLTEAARSIGVTHPADAPLPLASKVRP